MIDVEIDFASRLGEARNQGHRPTCLVFAGSDLNSLGNDVGHLSTEFLCHHAARLAADWKPGRGFQVYEVLAAVALPGQPFEHEYPYQPQASEAPLTAPTGDFALHTSHVSCFPDMQCNEIRALALAGRAVGIVIQMTQSVYAPKFGLIDFHPFVIPDEYHALIVVGVGSHSDTGEPYLLLRNSWGTSWGIDGHAWISALHLNLLLHESFLL